LDLRKISVWDASAVHNPLRMADAGRTLDSIPQK